MSSLVVLIGGLLLGLGLAVSVTPAVLRRFLQPFLEPRWRYWMSGLRVLLGGVLVAAAPATRLRGFVLGLGVLLMLAGASVPFLGEGRTRAMADWWGAQSDSALRTWGALAGLVGAILIWTGV
jgi:membrane protein HdeD